MTLTSCVTGVSTSLGQKKSGKSEKARSEVHMGQEVKTIQDVKEILKRRKKELILPPLIIFIIAAGFAFWLPRTYRSTATILIEEQEIPKEYAMSMVSSYAAQRIQSYNQRIMSSPTLIKIINRFNLYQELRQKMTIEQIIEKIRSDIDLNTITPEVGDRRTRSNTIAFSVSYEGKNREVVQQVANMLASLYLEENLKVREEKTAAASKFIEKEMNEVQASLANEDRKIAEYKQKHLNSLPEQAQLNLQELDRIERAIEQIQISLRWPKERESALQIQLAGTPRELANPESPKTEKRNIGKERLIELEMNLVRLKTRYSDQHPDIIKAKSEIAELEKKIKNPGGETIEDDADSPIGQARSDRSDNPLYNNITAQLASTRAEIDSLKRQIAALEKRRLKYQDRVANSPRVEEGFRAIIGSRSNLQAKYDDLMKKHMETKIAAGLEKDQMGERFTLIDPASLPVKPIKPNVPAIIFIGLVLGLGGGIGTVALREYSDPSVRSVETLARATGITVLASIPEILTAGDIARRTKKRIAWAVSTLLLFLVCIAVFHYFIMDVEVLWAKMARHLPI